MTSDQDETLLERRGTAKAKSRGIVVVLLSACLVAAGLATASTAVATPSPTVQASQQTEWEINDDPVLNGSPLAADSAFWRAGDPASAGKGYGPAKYFGGSNYVYSSATGGHNPKDNDAQWTFESRVGTQEVAVFIPREHASATVNYKIFAQDGNRIADLVKEKEVAQQPNNGWITLGEITANGRDIYIVVEYNDSKAYLGRTGAGWRSVGVDAAAMHCVRNCRSTTTTRPTTTTTQQGTALSSPRNLSVVPHGSTQLRATWSPPSNGSVENYTVEISRPAIIFNGRRIGPWSPTPRTISGTTYTSGQLRQGVTYTVSVRANGADQTSASVTTKATVKTATMKPVRNLRASSPGEGILEVTWDRPIGATDSGVTDYRIEISRPEYTNHPVFGDLGPFKPSRNVSETSHTYEKLFAGMRYTVTVAPRNASGTRGPESTLSVVTSPKVRTTYEERRWFIDRPDVRVYWRPVDDALQYHLDWRYVEIDTKSIRRAINNSDSSTVTDLLEGTVVPHDDVEGKSKPQPGNNYEILFNAKRGEFWDLRESRRRVRTFDPSKPAYEVSDIQTKWILQVRMRAVGDGWTSDWSDWGYSQEALLTAGCTAFRFYEDIKTAQEVIEAAGLALTIAGVAGAFFSGGTSVLASQAARVALVKAVEQVVKKILLDISLKKIVRKVVQEAIEQVVKKVATAAMDTLVLLLACSTYLLNPNEVSANATEFGKEFISQLVKDGVVELSDNTKDEFFNVLERTAARNLR